MSINVTNTDSDLSGKTIVTAEGDRVVSGNLSFNRSPGAPFTVQAGSANVSNLDADKLDGLDSTYFLNAANLSSGTIPSARLGSGSANKTTFLRGDQTYQPAPSSPCQGRLTLTSGTPVTRADVTGATTIYFTPYGGSYIGLYDGSVGWDVLKFSETSLALGTLTNDLPYDVFAYNNSGTLALELLAWTSKTARATALVLQDGVYSKTGALTRRYLGTFHTTSTTQTEDSKAKRLVWNYYNRVRRPMLRQDTTATWTYATNTWRQANASTANQLAVVIGMDEVSVSVNVHGVFQHSNVTGYGVIGVGEDSTSAVAAESPTAIGNNDGATAAVVFATDITLTKEPSVGYHFYSWLENTTGATMTVQGYNVGSTVYAGSMMSGFIEG